MKFVMQKTPEHLMYDFQYTLFQAKEYYTWLDSPKPEELRTEFEITMEDDPCILRHEKEYCPVGSVEFCTTWFKTYWGKTPKPRNVPLSMIKNVSCRRKIFMSSWFKDEEWVNLFRTPTVYIKSMENIKDPQNGLYNKASEFAKKAASGVYGEYQFSEEMDFLSEWRCFIYNGELQDLKCYSGDPFKMPTRIQIKNKIDAFKNPPVAYTMDLAIAKQFNDPVATRNNLHIETVEVHDFFACGLYGFSNLRVYPLMLWRWFKEWTHDL